MRVTGSYNKRSLHILIDSGNTHNSLNIQVAKKLGCKIEALNPLQVTMTDGNKLKIQAMVKNIIRTLQQNNFQANMMLIRLGCCYMVLEIDWLVQ